MYGFPGCEDGGELIVWSKEDGEPILRESGLGMKGTLFPGSVTMRCHNSKANGEDEGEAFFMCHQGGVSLFVLTWKSGSSCKGSTTGGLRRGFL